MKLQPLTANLSDSSWAAIFFSLGDHRWKLKDVRNIGKQAVSIDNEGQFFKEKKK